MWPREDRVLGAADWACGVTEGDLGFGWPIVATTSTDDVGSRNMVTGQQCGS